MEITIRWFTDSKYPSFNVELASTPDRDPFITIKGCRIANSENGEFVGWPATKNQNTGKYWNHVYASKEFAEAVLEKAKEAQPKMTEAKAKVADNFDNFDSDISF